MNSVDTLSIEACVLIPVPVDFLPVETIKYDSETKENVCFRKVEKGDTRPLFTVNYTGKTSGKTGHYGVFWHGTNTDGVESFGLRRMTNDGRRMCKPTKFNKGFFVPVTSCRPPRMLHEGRGH
jgi:hypothetical protein